MASADQIVEEFAQKEIILGAYCKSLHTLIEELLRVDGIRVHSVTERVKGRKNLNQKLLRPNKHYESLDQITDQIGLRVITYYEDEVDQVARTIRREFLIDEENSVDKRIQSDPEKFTYSSLHFVCSLHARRAGLLEYRNYADFKFEIQVRSILQHAWAEIQHDWYDYHDDLPHEVKRRFSRLAGLLDLADSEFLEMRKQKAQYERSVAVMLEANVPDMSDVALDGLSLESFIRQDELVHGVDAQISSIMGRAIQSLDETIKFHGMSTLAQSVGLATLQDLRNRLTQYQQAILEYVTECAPIWSSYMAGGTLVPGVCILYLSFILISRESDEFIENAYSKARFRRAPHFDDQVRIAKRICEKYKIPELPSH